MRFVAMFAVVGSLLLTVDPSTKASSASDPPRIVRWSAIGSATIGSTRAEIHRVYGQPAGRSSLRRFWPAGTKYAGRNVNDETYRVQSGTLYVRYVGNVVKMVQTTSSRYRTPDGIHVTSSLFRGSCRGAPGDCSYRFKGFVFDDCTNSWYLHTPHVDVEIGMNRSLFRHTSARVVRISFGDPDVVLHCF